MKTTERKVIKRRNRKKPETTPEIPEVNTDQDLEEAMEKVEMNLFENNTNNEQAVEANKNSDKIEIMPHDNEDNVVIIKEGHNEMTQQENPVNTGAVVRLQTEEMLDQVNQSDGNIKMKHKSFTKLGNRNLSFEADKMGNHNFNKQIDIPNLSQTSLTKNGAESKDTLTQIDKIIEQKNEGEANGYNRVLAESMRKNKEDVSNTTNKIASRDHHSHKFSMEESKKAEVVLSKAEDSQFENKLITQETSFAKNSGPNSLNQTLMSRDVALSKGSKKIINRSFQQTMKSIYDGVDKTLNIIEISENTEGESQERDSHKYKMENLKPFEERRRETVEKGDLNETIKNGDKLSKREIFMAKMGVPLETMMTAPTVPSKREEALTITDNKPNQRNSVSKKPGKDILNRHSKMTNQQNNQIFMETRSAMGLPLNRQPMRNDRRIILSRQNMPFNSKLKTKLAKGTSPGIGTRNGFNHPPRVMTKSVENFPMGRRRPGQYYQRWNPSVRRTNSPPLYQMNHQLDNVETLSMPGNVMFLRNNRPLSSYRPPGNRSVNMSPQFQRGMNRQQSESFLPQRQGSPKFIDFSNYSNQIPRMSSNSYQQNRPVSARFRQMSPNMGNPFGLSGSRIALQPRPQRFQQFSREDMENRMIMLIKKILVYSSKIESIKKKIIRQNPKFNAIPIFDEFSQNKQQMGLEELYQLFQAFGFHPPSISVYKIMIYLSNYVLESSQNQDSGLTQDTLENSLNHMPKEYTITPEGRLASIRKLQNDPYMRNDQMYPQRPYSAFNGNQQGRMKTISLNDFRNLFESDNEITKENKESHQLKEIDYHLIRQIFMLVSRMLEDLAKIIRTIQPYGSLEIFSYFLEFNNVNKDSGITNKNLNFKEGIRPQDSIDNAINFNKNNQTSPFKKTLKKTNKKGYNFSKKSKYEKQLNVEDADDESSIDEKIQNFENGLLNNKNQNNIRNSPVIKREINYEKTVGLNTLSSLLDFHNVQYISDDLHLVLKTFGKNENRISLKQFDRFLASPLWNL